MYTILKQHPEIVCAYSSMTLKLKLPIDLCLPPGVTSQLRMRPDYMGHLCIQHWNNGEQCNWLPKVLSPFSSVFRDFCPFMAAIISSELLFSSRLSVLQCRSWHSCPSECRLKNSYLLISSSSFYLLLLFSYFSCLRVLAFIFHDDKRCSWIPWNLFFPYILFHKKLMF